MLSTFALAVLLTVAPPKKQQEPPHAPARSDQYGTIQLVNDYGACTVCYSPVGSRIIKRWEQCVNREKATFTVYWHDGTTPQFYMAVQEEQTSSVRWYNSKGELLDFKQLNGAVYSQDSTGKQNEAHYLDGKKHGLEVSAFEDGSPDMVLCWNHGKVVWEAENRFAVHKVCPQEADVFPPLGNCELTRAKDRTNP